MDLSTVVERRRPPTDERNFRCRKGRERINVVAALLWEIHIVRPVDWGEGTTMAPLTNVASAFDEGRLMPLWPTSALKAECGRPKQNHNTEATVPSPLLLPSPSSLRIPHFRPPLPPLLLPRCTAHALSQPAMRCQFEARAPDRRHHIFANKPGGPRFAKNLHPLPLSSGYSPSTRPLPCPSRQYLSYLLVDILFCV